MKSTQCIFSPRSLERAHTGLYIWQKTVLRESSMAEEMIRYRCAVKRIDDVFRTKTDAKRTLREISILRQCNHPNIARLK